MGVYLVNFIDLNIKKYLKQYRVKEKKMYQGKTQQNNEKLNEVTHTSYNNIVPCLQL